MNTCNAFKQQIIHQLSLRPTPDARSRLPLQIACNIDRSIALGTMPKRKSYSALAQEKPLTTIPIPGPFDESGPPPAKRRASQRKLSQAKPAPVSTNPEENADVLDGPEALRASPDADEAGESVDVAKAGMDVKNQVKAEEDGIQPPEYGTASDSPLSEMSDVESPAKKSEASGKLAKPKVKEAAKTKAKATAKEPQFLDPEAEGDEEADEEEIQAALSRPPPVHSDYLPLPWKGRIGYVSSLRYRRCRGILADSHRPVSVHTYAFRILLCLAHGLAALLQSSKTDIP